MLLLLCLEMIVKYVPWNGDYGYELFMGGNGPFLRLVTAIPDNGAIGINLSTGILIAHGWFYVVYLLSCFRLWSLMRWEPLRLIIMLIGGVVPTLSFFVEEKFAKEVTAKLAESSKPSEGITTA